MKHNRFIWEPGDFTVTTAKSYAKAEPDDLERLLAQSDQISAQVRQAFLESVRRLEGRIDLDQIAGLLQQGRIDEAIALVNAQNVVQGYGPLLDAITAASIGVARDAGRLANLTAGLQVNFSQTNPVAVDYLRRYEMDLIREITQDTLANVRAVIFDGVAAGRNPIDIARDVRQFIGLTRFQTQAVMNYRNALTNGAADALSRVLRDRRFDPTVRRAVNGVRGLSSDQIARLTERYAQRYLKYRSETIARTEAKRALGSGNQLLWAQAVEQGKVDADQVTKKWMTVGDHKVRHAHVELHGQSIGLNDRFQSSGGSIAYPGDPSAAAGMTINCRCTAIYRFKVKEPATKVYDESKHPRDDHGRWVRSDAAQKRVDDMVQSLRDYAEKSKDSLRERLVVMDRKTGEVIDDHEQELMLDVASLSHQLKPGSTFSDANMFNASREYHPDASILDLHTHPIDQSFSDGDWRVFARHTIGEMKVVSAKNEYTLTKTPEYLAKPWQERTPAEHNRVYSAHVDRIADRMLASGPTPDDWIDHVLHEANVATAKDFGVHYQVKPLVK